MKQFFFFFLMLCLTSKSLMAQQIPLPGQNTMNTFLYNPAMLNLDHWIYEVPFTDFIGISFRKQWTGIQDGPLTGVAQYERKLESFNSLIGISLLKDETGPTGILGAYLRYAYQIKFNDNTHLSIGTAVGFLQHRYDGSKMVLRDANDIVGLEQRNKNLVDFSLGMHYSHLMAGGDILYVGLSIPQLSSFAVSSSGEEADFQVFKKQHFNATVGFYKFIDGFLGSDSEVTFIEPSININYVPNAPVKLNGFVRLQMTDFFWIGGGYAHSFGYGLSGSNNLSFGAGFLINNDSSERMFKLSYRIDRSLSFFQIQLDNTHEINLSYQF